MATRTTSPGRGIPAASTASATIAHTRRRRSAGIAARTASPYRGWANVTSGPAPSSTTSMRSASSRRSSAPGSISPFSSSRPTSLGHGEHVERGAGRVVERREAGCRSTPRAVAAPASSRAGASCRARRGARRCPAASSTSSLRYSTLPPLASHRRRVATASTGPPSSPVSSTPVFGERQAAELDPVGRTIDPETWRWRRVLVRPSARSTPSGTLPRRRPGAGAWLSRHRDVERRRRRGGADDHRRAERTLGVGEDLDRRRVVREASEQRDDSAVGDLRGRCRADDPTDRPALRLCPALTSRSSRDLPTPASPSMTTATGGSRSSRSKIPANSAARPTSGQSFTPRSLMPQQPLTWTVFQHKISPATARFTSV